MRVNKTFQYSSLLNFCYLLCISSFVLPNIINSYLLVLLAIVSVYGIYRKQFKVSGYASLVLFPILFLYLVIGLFYSENQQESLSLLERHLSLLFLPLIVQSSKALCQSQKEKLQFYFILSLGFVGLVCLGFACYNSLKAGSVYIPEASGHFAYNYFMHHRLTAPFGLHAVFFSFYISFANILIINALSRKVNLLTRKVKYFYRFAFVFFCILLFLLKSANFALSFPIICFLFFFIKFRKKLQPLAKKILLFSIFLCTTLFTYYGVKSKLDSFSTSYNYSDKQLRPLAIRLATWNCAWEIIQEDLIFGQGTGDANEAILRKYNEKNFLIGQNNKFNTHNMYLQYWLSNGIFAVILLITIFSVLLFYSIKHRNYSMFAFILFFAVFSLTESTMLKHKGIVFFVFFSSLFYWNPNFGNGKTHTLSL